MNLRFHVSLAFVLLTMIHTDLVLGAPPVEAMAVYLSTSKFEVEIGKPIDLIQRSTVNKSSKVISIDFTARIAGFFEPKSGRFVMRTTMPIELTANEAGFPGLSGGSASHGLANELDKLSNRSAIATCTPSRVGLFHLVTKWKVIEADERVSTITSTPALVFVTPPKVDAEWNRRIIADPKSRTAADSLIQEILDSDSGNATYIIQLDPRK